MRLRTLLALTALTVPAAALALGTGASIQAQPSHTKMPKSALPKFKKADTNHDGKIEWNEAKSLGVPKKLFKRDDFNQSGKLNKTEWQIVRMETPANKKGSPPGDLA